MLTGEATLARNRSATPEAARDVIIVRSKALEGTSSSGFEQGAHRSEGQ